MTEPIQSSWKQFMKDIEQQIEHCTREIDTISDYNQWKVLEAFQKFRVSDYHFSGSTGYGYNDVGREILDAVYAEVFGAEAGLVRPHFASGTHTIAVALFGLLRPGDELLYITGQPYDTLHKVIGKPNDGTGSLQDFGIHFDAVNLLEDGSIDWETIELKCSKRTKVIGIQRSRGYDWRPSFSIEHIQAMADRIKQIAPEAIIFVDNCYGEFTEMKEPTEVGVDIIAGSLIKNPGGGMAASGGYIVGKKELVELASYRQTAPGIGNEVGAMLGETRSIFQGLFMAPLLVGQALKGSVFTAACFDKFGFNISPHWSTPRTDLIQAIQFTEEAHLISFVQSIQKSAPVDSHVVPEPSSMPGYEHPVIMAAGTFIQGGSLELSADAPIRAPYIAYIQGGLTYAHVKYAVLQSLKTMQSQNLLSDNLT